MYSSVWALTIDDQKILNKAYKESRTSNESKLYRVLHTYKNLYLRSQIYQDRKLKKLSLEGIIKVGSKLNEDINVYRKEYKKFNIQKNKQVKKVKQIKKTKQIKKAKQIKNIKKQKQFLYNAIYENNKLELDFKKSLLNKLVLRTIIKKNGAYLHIFTIKGILEKNINIVKTNHYKKIKLVQYNKQIMRVVIESKFKRQFSVDVKDTSIFIYEPKLQKHIKRIIPKAKKIFLTPKIINRNYAKYKIVIDPGHGGADGGAAGHNKIEKNIVLKISKALKKELKAFGFQVYMTRSRDKFIKLRDRTAYANRNNASLFISIHANAVPNKTDSEKVFGIETYFLSPAKSERAKMVAEKENKIDLKDMGYFAKNSYLGTLNRHKIIASNKLALDVQQAVLGKLSKYYTKIKDDGVREAPFWVLVGAQMPAILIEVGFVSNKKESGRLADREYQKRFANGIAKGIMRYFNKNY